MIRNTASIFKCLLGHSWPYTEQVESGFYGNFEHDTDLLPFVCKLFRCGSLWAKSHNMYRKCSFLHCSCNSCSRALQPKQSWCFFSIMNSFCLFTQRAQAVLQAVSAVQDGSSPSSDPGVLDLAPPPSPVLRIIIDNMFYPVTLDVLQQVKVENIFIIHHSD